MAANNQEHPVATGTDEYTQLTLYAGFINNLTYINQVHLGHRSFMLCVFYIVIYLKVTPVQ
jgi:hypothetical protein